MKPVLIFVACVLACGCSALPYVVEPVVGNVKDGASEVYVVSHGWHTGFVVPADAIQSHMPELKKRFGNTLFIEFGWGDKGFYQAKEITSGLTMRAIFWPTESVVHAVAVPMSPAEYFPQSQVEMLCLDASEYTALIGFIENSFFRDESGLTVELKNGLYGDAQFYKGAGEYYLMNTCNKWTAKGLKSAGVDVNPLFKLTASSVMDVLEESDKAYVNGGCAIKADE